MNTTEKEFHDGFEMDGVTHAALEAKGEQAVRYALAQSKYGTPDTTDHKTVLAWLALKDSNRSNESLSIARQALRNSRCATITAIIAIILSARSIIKEVISHLIK